MGSWDVIVVGGGPAGLSAGHAAARAGARTLVLERAIHPRYKTCGGGLVGTSLSTMPAGLAVPVRARVHRATFSHDGRREFTRERAGPTPLVTMVLRAELDDELRRAALAAGADVSQHATVRTVAETTDGPVVRLADGAQLAARVVVGADGSAGVTSRYVGVEYDQVDLGLEVEIPVGESLRRRWDQRLLIDWGPLPGSYGWLFPKGDLLTVGVIASRGHGAETKRYLHRLVARLGLDGIDPLHDSGHLTKCRSDRSPLHRGRVLVAGDAAGLLEPWTREGISFALRSGSLAGAAAAAGDVDGYVTAVTNTLVPAMHAGRRLLRAFSRRPELFHGMLRTRWGWRMFANFCRGDRAFDSVVDRLPIRTALALIGRRV